MVLQYQTCSSCSKIRVRRVGGGLWSSFDDANRMISMIRAKGHQLQANGNSLCPNCKEGQHEKSVLEKIDEARQEEPVPTEAAHAATEVDPEADPYGYYRW